MNPDFAIALSEIKAGKKRSHWIWYIFPQLQGLGYSLNHPVLGERLIRISRELLKLASNDAYEITIVHDAVFFGTGRRSGIRRGIEKIFRGQKGRKDHPDPLILKK